MAHLSPDTPAVDVAVTPTPGGAAARPAPSFRGAALRRRSRAYERLAPGSYAVAVRAAGAGPGTAPGLSLAVDLTDGAARTVTSRLDRFADLRLHGHGRRPQRTAVRDGSRAGRWARQRRALADLSVADGPHAGRRAVAWRTSAAR